MHPIFARPIQAGALAVTLVMATLACGSDSTAPESVPVIAGVAPSTAPTPPAGLLAICSAGPDTFTQAGACPVVEWAGERYWAFSHTDNRFGMTIVAYSAAGAVVKQIERTGARYLWQITSDAAARTVTFWGQSSNSITVTWDDLKQR